MSESHKHNSKEIRYKRIPTIWFCLQKIAKIGKTVMLEV